MENLNELSKEDLIEKTNEFSNKLNEMDQLRSESHRLKLALHSIEERYNAIFECSPLGKSLTEVDGTLRINQSFADLLGYSVEELKEKNWKEITHPDDIQESSNIVQALLDGKKEMAKYEKRYLHKDGHIIWTEVSTALKRDKNNNPKYFITTINDITERKNAEKRLQETTNLLSEVLNTIPIRVFWKDLESNYLGCNLPFAQDAGLEKPEEVVGKTDYELFVKEHAENFRSDDQQVMETGIPKIGFEEPQSNFDGLDHWLRTSKVPLREKDGKIKGVLGTYEDITDKKQIEEELKKYRDELEELVKQRTFELETKNKELNNAMKVFVGRELAITQLQSRIRALEGK